MDKILSAIWEKEKQHPQGRFTKLFAENLRTLRIESGYTQRAVTEALGIPESTYANWEQGRREPSITDIFRILILFKVDATALFSADETHLSQRF